MPLTEHLILIGVNDKLLLSSIRNHLHGCSGTTYSVRLSSELMISFFVKMLLMQLIVMQRKYANIAGKNIKYLLCLWKSFSQDQEGNKFAISSNSYLSKIYHLYNHWYETHWILLWIIFFTECNLKQIICTEKTVRDIKAHICWFGNIKLM